MVRALQGGYGMPGLEQLTAAVDLAQTQFECCAITNDLNYDTSLWRLQAHGRTEWTVPLTCCRLDNAGHFGAYLDPMPANETQCQSLERAENAAERHPKVKWLGEDYLKSNIYNILCNSSGLFRPTRPVVSPAIHAVRQHNSHRCPDRIRCHSVHHLELHAIVDRFGRTTSSRPDQTATAFIRVCVQHLQTTKEKTTHRKNQIHLQHQRAAINRTDIIGQHRHGQWQQ